MTRSYLLARNVPATEGPIAEATVLLERGGQLEREGKAEQAVEVLLQALAMVADQDSRPLKADLLYRTAVLRTRLGQTETAENLFNQSLEVATWCDYTKGQAWAVNGLAIIAQRKGDTALAESQFRRARRLALSASEHRLIGILEMNLGVIANVRGDLDSALVHYENSLTSFSKSDDLEATCWALNNIGMLQTDLGCFGESDRTFTRGLKLAKKTGDRVMEGMLEVNRAEALVGLERWRAARQGCRRAIKIAEGRGDTLQHAQALKFLGIVERGQWKTEAAVAALNEAAELAGQADDRLLEAEIARELGEVWLQHGDIAKARLEYGIALQHFVELDAVLDAADLRKRLDDTLSSGATPQTSIVVASP